MEAIDCTDHAPVGAGFIPWPPENDGERLKQLRSGQH